MFFFFYCKKDVNIVKMWKIIFINFMIIFRNKTIKSIKYLSIFVKIKIIALIV